MWFELVSFSLTLVLRCTWCVYVVCDSTGVLPSVGFGIPLLVIIVPLSSIYPIRVMP